jgi:hypothetical protein
MSPGGIGVDIKHNSYERYLNKLKGKAPLRRGIIPPRYGEPIPFNRAFPVYGGKTVKTAIVNGCDCPDITDNSEQDKRIYGNISNATQDEILSVKYQFHIGDFVWGKKYATDNALYKGKIIDIKDSQYTVKFDGVTRLLFYCDLFIYFDCSDCVSQLSLTESLLTDFPYQKHFVPELNEKNNIYCHLLNLLSAEGGIN